MTITEAQREKIVECLEAALNGHELDGNELYRLINELKPDPAEAAGNAVYIAAARKQYEAEGEIEFDDAPVISRSDDGGAYVQAWVWVDDEKPEVKPNTALVGKRVRLLKPDFDSDENDERREIPVGTLGVISAVAHVDRDGLTNYDLLWDNGGWTIYTEAEVATDMEVISGT